MQVWLFFVDDSVEQTPFTFHHSFGSEIDWTIDLKHEIEIYV